MSGNFRSLTCSALPAPTLDVAPHVPPDITAGNELRSWTWSGVTERMEALEDLSPERNGDDGPVEASGGVTKKPNTIEVDVLEKEARTICVPAVLGSGQCP